MEAQLKKSKNIRAIVHKQKTQMLITLHEHYGEDFDTIA